jgi:peptidyl-prolyl cis-trans isomerase C
VNRALLQHGHRVAILGLMVFAAGCAGTVGGAGGPSSLAGGGAKDTSAVLVRVGKSTLTRGMLQARIDAAPDQYKSMYATSVGRQQLIDRMTEELIWVNQATREGVADRPVLRDQIEQQRRDLLIRTYLNEKMATSPAPSDSEAQVYYDAHLNDYRTPASITLRHIQTPTEAEAKRILKLVRSGKDFGVLARSYSADTASRVTGGLLGTVIHSGPLGSIGMQPALSDSAFTLAAGKVGGPWKSDRGWHLIKVDTVRPESTRPFDQARPLIIRQMSSQHAQDYYKKILDEARKTLGVSSDSAAIKGFLSHQRSEAEMFKEAQDATAPMDRIGAYGRLLTEYPNGEKAAQSQFMVGFIFSEDLKNYDEAEKAFHEVVNHFPKSELAASAQWMLDHMRTEDAPAFVTQEADSSRLMGLPPKPQKPGSAGKP